MTPRPLILIRGFGGLDISGEQASAYQGFNDGTVYPGRRGENYIYEGFLLRCLKDRYRYTDATNVIGYYAEEVDPSVEPGGYSADDVKGKVAIDPKTAERVLKEGTAGTMWVYRYYDLSPRALKVYGEGLVTLINLIQTSARLHNETFRGVDIVAHSMGGLVVRAALKKLHNPEITNPEQQHAAELIHRIVTLGTPHRGIAFQRIPNWVFQYAPGADQGSDEFAAFDPTSVEFLQVAEWFPIGRILTVVGTNYRSYGTAAASIANRLATLLDEGNLVTNRSDGLVKQASAQLPGAPRTFVHKCHGGQDSLVTSREAYEIAMRFFHGTHRVRLWLQRANITRGHDMFGHSEFYFGVSIKPRYVDFDLFHQSPEAENCYGPFNKDDMLDGPPDLERELRKPLAEPGDKTTGWAGPDRLIWQGWIDANANPEAQGLVFRLDVYLGERDSHGVGFSDNVIFRKQYYVQAFPDNPLALFVHTGERYLSEKHSVGPDQLEHLSRQPVSGVQLPTLIGAGGPSGIGTWTFEIKGTGFDATLRVEIQRDQFDPPA